MDVASRGFVHRQIDLTSVLIAPLPKLDEGSDVKTCRALLTEYGRAVRLNDEQYYYNGSGPLKRVVCSFNPYVLIHDSHFNVRELTYLWLSNS